MEAKKEKRRSVVASGKNVEDAIRNGLTMLGVSRDKVDIEILTEGSRGVLGFGAENARVQIFVKAPPAPKPPAPKPPAPKPAPARDPEPKSQAPAKPVEKREKEPKSEVQQDAQTDAPEHDRATLETVGQEILSDLLRMMGIRASVEIKIGHELADEGEEPPVVLNITGDDLGILIGRRGETLRAMQYLVRLMASHRLKHWTNLVVDVENYLVRRRQTLEGLAMRVADRVASSGRTQALEPMPAYERRLVHIALRNHPKVHTQSVGEGERRKVTIVPKK